MPDRSSCGCPIPKQPAAQRTPKPERKTNPDHRCKMPIKLLTVASSHHTPSATRFAPVCSVTATTEERVSSRSDHKDLEKVPCPLSLLPTILATVFGSSSSFCREQPFRGGVKGGTALPYYLCSLLFVCH